MYRPLPQLNTCGTITKTVHEKSAFSDVRHYSLSFPYVPEEDCNSMNFLSVCSFFGFSYSPYPYTIKCFDAVLKWQTISAEQMSMITKDCHDDLLSEYNQKSMKDAYNRDCKDCESDVRTSDTIYLLNSDPELAIMVRFSSFS